VSATSHKVALIGCGNIGSRLLQALISAPLPAGDGLDVVVVDPAEDARALGTRRAEEVTDRPAHLRVEFAETLDALPGELALAIVATSSRPRAAIVEQLLLRTSPKALLLEKFLFTRPEAYASVGEVLEARDIPTFVHTPRPVWPGYLDLKARLTDDPLHMQVAGSGWAMASNAIHFVAAFEGLTGEKVTGFNSRHVDAATFANKRDGYHEVSGLLIATGDRASRLTLACTPAEPPHLTVDVLQGDRRYLVFEGDQRMQYRDGGTAWQETSFGILFASQMQSVLADLLQRGTCGLPRYRDLAPSHLALIEALDPIFRANGYAGEDFPVT
jgi:hypothetical protein